MYLYRSQAPYHQQYTLRPDYCILGTWSWVILLITSLWMFANICVYSQLRLICYVYTDYLRNHAYTAGLGWGKFWFWGKLENCVCLMQFSHILLTTMRLCLIGKDNHLRNSNILISILWLIHELSVQHVGFVTNICRRSYIKEISISSTWHCGHLSPLEYRVDRINIKKPSY